MVNKKGFLRIVEATIAILLIFVALVFLSGQREGVQSRDVGEVVPPLMDEISRNLSFREKVAGGGDEEVIENYVEKTLKLKIPSSALNVSVEVCNLTEVCFLDPYPDTESDIYSSERIVSGSIKNKTFEPKKIKVFVWRQIG